MNRWIKIIIAITALLLMAGGIIAGILLVRQEQELREKATSQECSNTVPSSDGSSEACYGKSVGDSCSRAGVASGRCDDTGFREGGVGTTPGTGPIVCACEIDTTIPVAPPPPAATEAPSQPQDTTPVGNCSSPDVCVPKGYFCDGGDKDCEYDNCGEVGRNAGSGTACNAGYEGFCCGSLPGVGGGPAATPDTRSICGGTCTTDTDCKDSTYPGVDVVCRGSKCVSKQCFDKGGTTKPGTLCECDQALGLCGDSCGLAIGLCQSPYTCTYLAQSQCAPQTQYPVCVPNGTVDNRGPISGVPEYQNDSFERRRCGGTLDPENNYIYHPAFPSGLTQTQVRDLICNPQPPITASAQCLNILVFDENWRKLATEELLAKKSGEKIRFTVLGTTASGTFDMARFKINDRERSPVTAKRPGTQEFYDEYTILENDTSLSVEAELHHTTLGWF